jgi:transcriptional antiterminator NusG
MTEQQDQQQAAQGSKPKGQWFTVQVLSGMENRVLKSMESRIKSEELSDSIFEVVVPTERVSEVKRGKKTETERKLYPGYIFLNMALYDEDKKINSKPWYFVLETPNVIGFIDGEKPVPMREGEAEAMLAQLKENEDKVLPKILFVPGDKVRVGDGPFESQEGTIEEVDPDRGRVRVAVSIFGRSTPVELEYWQVEKIQ